MSHAYGVVSTNYIVTLNQSQSIKIYYTASPTSSGSYIIDNNADYFATKYALIGYSAL